MLTDAAELLGERQAAVARELTKLFETVKRGTIGALAAEFEASGPPKGEIVVLIGPKQHTTDEALDLSDLDSRLQRQLARLSVKDATAVTVEETGLPRKLVYGRAIMLARGED